MCWGSGRNGGRFGVWTAASLGAVPAKEALLSAGLSSALVCPACGPASLLALGLDGCTFCRLHVVAVRLGRGRIGRHVCHRDFKGSDAAFEVRDILG